MRDYGYMLKRGALRLTESTEQDPLRLGVTKTDGPVVTNRLKSGATVGAMLGCIDSRHDS